MNKREGTMTEIAIAQTGAGEGTALRRSPLALRLARLYRTEIAIALAIVAILVGVSFWSPYVLTWGNLANIAQASAPLILMSIGVFLVIATSGIDLSVGSTFSLTGMVAGLLLSSGLPWPLACLLSLGVGLGVGALNGGLVTFVGLAPFVVTLITYAIGASLSFVITDGHSIAIADPNFWLLNGGELVPGVTNFVLFCAIAVVVVELLLRKLVIGRWIFAIGSNDKAARLLGVPVRGVRFTVYVACGLSASFASILSLSYISNSEATSGANLMLQAIAACVIGGASLFGGTGSAVGAMLGAIMITVIQNGVNLIGINSFWQGTVTGCVILVAVLIDRATKVRS